jgi:hypothetical protein
MNIVQVDNSFVCSKPNHATKYFYTTITYVFHPCDVMNMAV